MAAKAKACCLFALLPAVAASEEQSLADAFREAVQQPSVTANSIAIDIDGCVIKHVITNKHYCAGFGEGDADRVITKIIDLREVKEIRAEPYRDDFLFSFELDFDGPGANFIFLDRIFKGSDGAFDRYREKRAAALQATDLRSGVSFSNCDGTTTKEKQSSSETIFIDAEPEGWMRIVALAKECRGSEPMTLSD